MVSLSRGSRSGFLVLWTFVLALVEDDISGDCRYDATVLYISVELVLDSQGPTVCPTSSYAIAGSSRRRKPIEQLVCIGDAGESAGCPQDAWWRFATALCRNQGAGDDGQPRWECSADLPRDATFHSVEVSCEGYDSRDDPNVLVGSCSLFYSLDSVGPGFYEGGFGSGGFNLGHLIFLIVFGFFAYRILRSWRKPSRSPPPVYSETPSPYPADDDPQAPYIATGEPVMATAVPIEDLENPRPTGSRKSSNGEVIAGGAAREGDAAQETIGMQTAQTVGMTEETIGRAEGVRIGNEGEGRSRYPPQRIDDLDLPEGWEMRIDPASGERYFVDHRRRRTSWTDPREAEWRRSQHRDFDGDQQFRPSAGFARPFGLGMLGGFALARGLQGVGGLRRGMRGHRMTGGGFRRFGGGGSGGFGGGGGFGGRGIRSGFGGTANR